MNGFVFDVYNLSVDYLKGKIKIDDFTIQFNEIKKNIDCFQIEQVVMLFEKIRLYVEENKVEKELYSVNFKFKLISFFSEHLHSNHLIREVLIVKKITKKIFGESSRIFNSLLILISKKYVVSDFIDKLKIDDQYVLGKIARNEAKHSPDILANNFKNFGIKSVPAKKKIAIDYAHKKNESISKYLQLFDLDDINSRFSLFLNELDQKNENDEITNEQVEKMLSDFDLSLEQLSNEELVLLFKSCDDHLLLVKFFYLFKKLIIERDICLEIFEDIFNLNSIFAIRHFDIFVLDIIGLSEKVKCFLLSNYQKITTSISLLYHDNKSCPTKKIVEFFSLIEKKTTIRRSVIIFGSNFIINKLIKTRRVDEFIEKNMSLAFSNYCCKKERLMKYKSNNLEFIKDSVYNKICLDIKFLNKFQIDQLDNSIKKEIKKTKHQLEQKLIYWHQYLTDKGWQHTTGRCRVIEFAIKIKAWKLASFLVKNHFTRQDEMYFDKNLHCHQPLIFNAVENKKLQFVDLLLKKGAELIPNNRDGYTPLHVAAFVQNNRKIISFLSEWQSLQDSISRLGFTPTYIANALETNFPEELPRNQALDQEIYDRKLLANCWNIDQTSFIKTASQKKKFELKGNLSPIGPKEVSRLFDLFIQENPSDHSILLNTQDILHDAVKTYTPAKKVLDAFYAGETINFPTGWELKYIIPQGHLIQLLFLGKYLLICNRGINRQEDSILIWEIDRNNAKLSLEHLEKLKKGWWNKDEAVDFIYNKLPQLAGALSDQTGVELLFKKIKQKTQKMGNCWWLSPKTGVFGILLILMTLKEQENLKEKEVEQKDSKESIYSQAQQIYKQFSEFCKIVLFKEYLIKKIEEKKKQDSESIYPDLELIQVTLKKFMAKFDQKYPKESEELLKLVKEFDDLYGPSWEIGI